MTAVAKLKPDVEVPADPLAKLREPFPAHQISKLPKPTKKQTEELRADFTKGKRCGVCGGWHQQDVVHLDYVGHAALTDRLLDTDPHWFWEPMALDGGLPAFDQSGGLWIKLTVCGVSRLGYGHAAAKPNMDPGAREKEVIGDALRNAAMRFGAALDLWHKGDLHVPDADEAPANGERPQRKSAAQAKRDLDHEKLIAAIKDNKTEAELDAWFEGFDEHTAHVPLSWIDPMKDEVEKHRNTILDDLTLRS